MSASPSYSPADSVSRQQLVIQLTRTGNLLKLGDGLMNRSWNSRYFLLRGSTLQYFTTPRDPKPREVIDLLHAEVTWLGDFMDKPNCIVIEPMAHRTIHISGSTLEESKQWMRWFQEAADPVAYADLHLPGSTSPFSSSPQYSVGSMTNQVRVSHTTDIKLPLDIPSHFVEVGHILEKIVNSGDGIRSPGLVLVDVSDGVRLFTTKSDSSSSTNSSNGTMLWGLVMLFLASLFRPLLVPFATIGSIILAYGYFSPKRRPTGEYAAAVGSIPVSLGGCRNWILDASKYSLWNNGVSSAFANKKASQTDTIHYVFQNGNHVSLERRWWDASDGSTCVVCSQNNHYEAWCIRPVRMDQCRVWYISSKLGSMDAEERAMSVLSGLIHFTAQYGDHDGMNIPQLSLPNWERHWKGGIVPEGMATIQTVDGEGIRKKLFQSILNNSRRISVKSVFPSSGRTPLQALPTLVSGLGLLDSILANHSGEPIRLITSAVLSSLVPSAAALAECAWARYHPKTGDSLLCWLGSEDKSPQVLLEVIEASRPTQGMFANIRITVTGQYWNLKGVIRYNFAHTRYGIAIELSSSELEAEISSGGHGKSRNNFHIFLPNLVTGVSKVRRVYWEGLVRVSEESGESAVMRIDPSGIVRGSVLHQNGRKRGDIDGHWLESLSIDNEVIWVVGKLCPPSVALKKASDVAQGKKDHHETDKRPPTLAAPRMSSADEEALMFIEQLRKEVVEIEKHAKRFTNEYLFRFCKARAYDFAETKRMIISHIDWLEENQVDDLLNFQYSELAQVKAAFPHGYHGVDKCGRPVYISRLAKTSQDALFQATDWDRFLKFWIQSYEELIWKKVPICTSSGGKNPHIPGLPPPSALAPLQTLTILDMKGIGLSQLSSKVREFISVTSKLASDNYPEILGTMYIVNTPAVFPMLWNAVKSMIDPGTRAKTHVLNAKQTKEKLLEVIEYDQLPCFLGGGCKCNPGAGGEDSDFGCLSSDKGPWN